MTYLWFFMINIRIPEPSRVELRKNLNLVKSSEIATFRRMYFGIPMDENFINLIFNPLFLFTAAKLAYPRSSNQKETAGHDENWYFGVHPFFRGHLDTYPWSSFQSDSFFFLCFFLRNLVACRIDLETAGWDSPMKNWSLGVENIICHVECSYSTKIFSSSFFLIYSVIAQQINSHHSTNTKLRTSSIRFELDVSRRLHSTQGFCHHHVSTWK